MFKDRVVNALSKHLSDIEIYRKADRKSVRIHYAILSILIESVK